MCNFFVCKLAHECTLILNDHDICRYMLALYSAFFYYAHALCIKALGRGAFVKSRYVEGDAGEA